MQNMEMHHGQQMEKRLSRKTPVLDNLEGIDPFIERSKQTVLENQLGIFDIYIFGESGAGKGTVAEELLMRLAEDPTLKRTHRRGKYQPTWKYYSLAMGLTEGYAAGDITSPWGQFTPEEFSLTTERMHQKLLDSERFPRPLIRVVETVALCEPPLNLGAELLRRAPLRAATDPTYRYQVLGVASTKDVQDRAMKVREGFEKSASTEELRAVLKKHHMHPDELDDLLAIQRSVGNKFAKERINGIDDANMITLQEELRQIDLTLPTDITADMLQKDDRLRTAALIAYMRYKLHEWQIPEANSFVAENPLLPRRQIPYLRRYVVTHKL